jgi:hypothetical protein
MNWALFINLVGLSLLFIGNLLVTDVLGRYGAHGLPAYKWGNRMQGLGFIVSLLGIYLSKN